MTTFHFLRTDRRRTTWRRSLGVFIGFLRVSSDRIWNAHLFLLKIMQLRSERWGFSLSWILWAGDSFVQEKKVMLKDVFTQGWPVLCAWVLGKRSKYNIGASQSSPEMGYYLDIKQKVAIWGRSMGAVVALLVAGSEQFKGIACLVIGRCLKHLASSLHLQILDSPYSSLQQLLEQLAHKYIPQVPISK